MVQYLNPLPIFTNIGRFLARNEIQKMESELTGVKSELDEAKFQLTRVLERFEQRFGGSEEVIDAQQVLWSEDDIRTKLREAEFFGEDGFYAIKPDTDSGSTWSYEPTTELSVMCDVLDLDPSSLPDEIQESGTMIPVHLWRSNKSFRIDNIQGEVTHMNLGSTIFVQRTPIQQWIRMIERSYRNETAQKGLDEEQIDELWNTTSEHYQSDPTGIYFVEQLKQLQNFAASSPSISLGISSIQRKGSNISTQFNIVFNGVVVDEESHNQFFLVRKLISIGTPLDLWLIRADVLTPDRRSEDFAWIGDWFSTFAIPRPL